MKNISVTAQQQEQRRWPSSGVSDGSDDAAVFCLHDEPCVCRKGTASGCAVGSCSMSCRCLLGRHPSTTDNHHDCGKASATGDVARGASCVASVG